jgi:hypothetical protein
MYKVGFDMLPLKERFNASVLGIKVGHVYNQILHDEHVTKRCDERWFGNIGVDSTNAGQGM